MIRVTRLADYGILLMTWFAQSEARHRRLTKDAPVPLVSATGLAQQTGLPAPTVSKLLRQLASSSLLVSSRGVRGGYRLARPASTISVADLLRALDGPLALTDCIDRDSDCAIESICTTRPTWNRINAALVAALTAITLEDMVAEPVATAPESVV